MIRWKLGISALCLLLAFIFQISLHVESVVSILLYIATLFSGIDVLHRAVLNIRNRIFGIEIIVTIAVLGAVLIGELYEAAIVTFLFAFGSYLEQRALFKTRLSLQNLFDFYPDTATIVTNDEERTIPADEVQEGDVLIVRPGDKVPADGYVKSGTALVNQAAITGESQPVRKNTGHLLYSGSLVESGYVMLVADKVGEQTTLSGILQMIENAEAAKAPVQQFLERFAKYYTPLITLLAIVVFLVTHHLNTALTLLVISCPGALVIAAPVSIVTAIGSGAKLGVLFKGGGSLERLAAIDTVAFDKTGTLTAGRPEVTRFESDRMTEDRFWRLVASAELPSEHYLAKAIIQEAKRRFGASVISEPESFTEVPGMGVQAVVDGIELWVGSINFLRQRGISVSPAGHAESIVCVADAQGLIGTIYIADQVRKDARETIIRLREAGIRKIVMLTGDHYAIAHHVASSIGIDEVYADLLPNQKMDVISHLQANGHKVAMFGDGINDGPALAAADIGISLYGGTDLALTHANVILMRQTLSSIADGFLLSHRACRILRQNILLAVGVAGILILGVLFGKVFLASGMFIHEVSILAVVLNALRLRTNRERQVSVSQTVSANSV
jgi:Zn2+/Cd2+-exporting ATPase